MGLEVSDMTRTVTATEAKNRLGALMSEVRQSDEPILVELRGRPEIAIITAAQLSDFEELKRKRRGEEAFAKLEAIRAMSGDRNNDLTEEEADTIVNQAIREVRQDLIKQGVLKFEQE
jgi:prevent-host-death family protein